MVLNFNICTSRYLSGVSTRLSSEPLSQNGSLCEVFGTRCHCLIEGGCESINANWRKGNAMQIGQFPFLIEVQRVFYMTGKCCSYN